MNKICSKLYLLTLTSLLASHALAEPVVGKLHINQAHARATVPGQPSGAAYLDIANQGSSDDSLAAISSPVAKSVQMHTMSMDNGVMKMREVDTITVAANSTISMHAGEGYHLMLIGLKHGLKAGDKFPLTLKFAKSGKVTVEAIVDAN